MVIHAEHVFTCKHEWLGKADGFICLKCELKADQLPLSFGRPGLFFFPTSVREAQQQKAG